MSDLILASASPRRKEILEIFTSKYKIITSDVTETLDKDVDIYTNLMSIAKRKGEPIKDNYPDSIIISADTVVLQGGKLLQKPINENQARDYLTSLSGKTHEVTTAFCIQGRNISVIDYESTIIEFKDLRSTSIDMYLKTGEWKDKAGAYGIQGVGSVLIEKIIGDYFNVVGLPISKIYQYLLDYFNYDLMEG